MISVGPVVADSGAEAARNVTAIYATGQKDLARGAAVPR
jgi:hypothetical protein